MPDIIERGYEGLMAQFTTDAWFNATVAAARFGRLPNEWLRLPETKEYLDALKRKYGKIPYLRTKRGNNGGTWLHPKLAVPFARWLDIDFALWCDEQIDQLIRGEINVRRARHQIATASPSPISTCWRGWSCRTLGCWPLVCRTGTARPRLRPLRDPGWPAGRQPHCRGLCRGSTGVSHGFDRVSGL